MICDSFKVRVTREMEGFSEDLGSCVRTKLLRYTKFPGEFCCRMPTHPRPDIAGSYRVSQDTGHPKSQESQDYW